MNEDEKREAQEMLAKIKYAVKSGHADEIRKGVLDIARDGHLRVSQIRLLEVVRNEEERLRKV